MPLSDNSHKPSAGLADEPAEDAKNGFYQLEIQRKEIMKILDIELESVNRCEGLYRVDSGAKI